MTDKNKEHIRAEFQKRLQSSLTAYGSNGAVIFEFIKDFKEDWQTDLYNIAKLLEYSDGVDGLIALMKSFPNDVVVEELPSGLVRFKPVPTVTTIENLNLIDQSNKEIAEHKERKIRLNQRQNPIHIRLSSVPPPIYPPQIFNQSHPISQNGQSVPPHLLPPYHRGYIPSSKPRVKQPISENANLIDLGVRAPLSQRQNGTGHQSRNKTNLLNGKEERMRDGRSSPPSFSRASTPRVISLHSSINDLTELEQAEREFSMKLGKGRPILGQTFEPLISDDEDFRVPASDDESTLTDVSSRIGSVSSLDNPIDSNKQSGTVTVDAKKETEVDEVVDEFDDEDDESFVSDDSEFDILFDEIEDAVEEKENISVCKYIDKLKNEFHPPQADLSRLLYLFQLNDGSLSSSKIDDLKRSYEREFGCALSSKELNRLLGCPPNIRIVGESFKKASYPASSFFRVIQSDSSSSLYTVKLRRCLTGEFIDPSIYFAKLPSRVVSRTSTPLPKISSISTITSNNNVPSTSTNTSLPIQPTTTVKSVDKPTFNSKLDFLKISIKISTIFDKNANGKILLNEIFEQLNKISPHPLLETKMGLLGYLMEFLADFCEILVEGDKIYILDIRNCPKLKKNNLISTASFNGFRSGNKLRVKILSVVSNGDAKLELCQLSSKLRLLLSDYSDLLEIIEEQPTKCLTPDSKRMVFFYDRSKRLRRGYITKKENESSVSIKDLDILDIQDHLVLNNCVFDVPENFPIWQFPACQFQAQIVNADMIQIRRFWKEGTEFSVIVNEIINGQKCFCRPLPINSMDVVDF
uniref:HTH OST-type domain-containing protein n=1 Tax=Meloidogyne incognita TaxID=6306 RepID=A0A914M8Y6_MELIC